MDELKMAMVLLDRNNDDMLDADELKYLFSSTNVPLDLLDEYVEALMVFDEDNNRMLDINGKSIFSQGALFLCDPFVICQIIKHFLIILYQTE